MTDIQNHTCILDVFTHCLYTSFLESPARPFKAEMKTHV